MKYLRNLTTLATLTLACASLPAQNQTFDRSDLYAEQKAAQGFLEAADTALSKAEESVEREFYRVGLTYTFTAKVRLIKAERYLEGHPGRIAQLKRSIWYDESAERKKLNDAFKPVREYFFELKAREETLDTRLSQLFGEAYRRRAAALEDAGGRFIKGEDAALDVLEGFEDGGTVSAEIEAEAAGNGAPSTDTPAADTQGKAREFAELIERILANPDVPEDVKARLRDWFERWKQAQIDGDHAAQGKLITEFFGTLLRELPAYLSLEDGEALSEFVSNPLAYYHPQPGGGGELPFDAPEADPVLAAAGQLLASDDLTAQQKQALWGDVQAASRAEAARSPTREQAAAKLRERIINQHGDALSETKRKRATSHNPPPADTATVTTESGETAEMQRDERGMWTVETSTGDTIIIGPNMEGIQRAYIGGDGKKLLEERKVSVAVGEDNVARLQTGDSRSWNLRVTTRGEISPDGKAQFALEDLDDAGPFTLGNWELLDRSNTVLASSTDEIFNVQFPDSGQYVVRANGQTDWGSSFQIDQRLSISLD